MAEEVLYSERLSSKWTEALFLGLMMLFGVLFLWRVSATRLDGWAAVLLCLCLLFLFYGLNYRTLVIWLTPEALKLTFGIFTWKVPLENVAGCGLDDVPALQRLGGAGIHFTYVRQRYRASFNFLEYPRVVIAFKRKVGPVRDISFSTRQPEEVLRHLQAALVRQESG